MNISHSNIVLKFYLNQLAVHWEVLLIDLKVSGMSDSVHLIKCMRQVLCLFAIIARKYGALKICNAAKIFKTELCDIIWEYTNMHQLPV